MWGQSNDPVEVARKLADVSKRDRTFSELASASSPDRVKMLVRLAEHPPQDIDRNGLFIGLADVFGQLRALESIPFLIKHIHMARVERDRIDMKLARVWMQSPIAIEAHFPAAGALVNIGPPASKALVALWEKGTIEDEDLVVFVVSQIADPEAKGFLTTVAGRSGWKLNYAEQGIKAIDAQGGKTP